MKSFTVKKALTGPLVLDELSTSISDTEFEAARKHIAARRTDGPTYPLEYETFGAANGYAHDSADIDAMAYPPSYLDAFGDLYTVDTVPDVLVTELLPVAIQEAIEYASQGKLVPDASRSVMSPRSIVAWYLPLYPLRQCGAVFTRAALRVSGLAEASSLHVERIRDALVEIDPRYADVFRFA